MVDTMSGFSGAPSGVVISITSPPTPETSLYIDPAQTNKDPSDTEFTVNVVIDDYTNFFGFEIELTWDSSLITYKSDDTSPLDSLWTSYYKSPTHDNAHYNLVATSTSTAASGTDPHNLFTFTFNIVKSCNFQLKSPIHFALVKLSDDATPTPNPIDARVADGMYYISGTPPDIEFKVKKSTTRENANYEYIIAPYKFEYCDWFEVEVYVTHICENSPLKDYDFTFTYDPTLVEFIDADYWGVLGDIGDVYYTCVGNEIRVWDDGTNGETWYGASGILFGLTFHVKFACDKDHVWRNCPSHDNFKTLDITITDVTLSFTESRTKTMGEIDIPVNPLLITINFIRGDVDCDGDVDINDIGLAAGCYGSTTQTDLEMYDLTCNNIIDIYDLVAIATNYGHNVK